MKKAPLLLFFYAAYFVARAQPNCWETAVTGQSNLNGSVVQIQFANGGTIYAIGGFTNDIGGSYVAYWNGSVWKEPGFGLNANAYIYSFCMDKAGHIYTAGQFTDSTVYSPTGSRYVAEFNGTDWIKLGTGSNAHFNDGISTVGVDDTGNVYACGSFTDADGYAYVAKWNGTAWSQLGNNFGLYGNEHGICIDKHGNIYVQAELSITDGSIDGVFKWDGNSWSQVGSSSERYNPNNLNSATSAITTDLTGNILYAAGTDTSDNEAFVAVWNGSNWNILGNYHFNGAIWSLVVDANNNLYVGGDFTDSAGDGYIAKWDGNAWTNLGDTAFGYMGIEVGVEGVCVDSDGVLYGTRIKAVLKDVCSEATSDNDVSSDLYSVNVYPNPSAGRWQISVTPEILNGTSSAAYEIYDVNGSVMYQSVIQSPSFEIAPPLAAGVYLLRIFAPGVNEVRKLVKL